VKEASVRVGTPAAHGDIGARLMLVLLCMVWGTTWPIMKIALEEVPPLSMRTASTAIGGLTLYCICFVTRRSLRIPNAKAWAHVFVASMLNIVGFSVLSVYAQLAAATSRVAILSYTMPVWSVLLAWIFLRERPTGRQTIALGLCAAGLAVLIYPLTAAGFPLGIGLAVATGLIWSAGTVYLKWARIDADPMGVAMWQMTLACIVIAACMMLFEGGPGFAAASPKALFATAVVGFAGNGIAYGLWFSIVGRLSAVAASLGVLGSPVIGVVTSILILGDRPTPADFVGFALILAACACILLGRQQSAKKIIEADLDAPARS
jgi:drug/metabolite transporter (DMT)-like permease